MKNIVKYINESQNKNLQNGLNALKNVFNVKPEYSEDEKYIYVKLETKRTYQYIFIYDEDDDHVMIKTSMYEESYVVPNTIEDIEKFLKSYKNGNVSDNAIEVEKYIKSK